MIKGLYKKKLKSITKLSKLVDELLNVTSKKQSAYAKNNIERKTTETLIVERISL